MIPVDQIELKAWRRELLSEMRGIEAGLHNLAEKMRLRANGWSRHRQQ